MFELPRYHGPDLTAPEFVQAPQVRWEAVSRDGVAPEGYHSTSMYPEYFKIGDSWHLAEESRMDCCVIYGKCSCFPHIDFRNRFAIMKLLEYPANRNCFGKDEQNEP